jgi:hypothetical protein
LGETSGPVRLRSGGARTAMRYDHGRNGTATLREPQNAKDRRRRSLLRRSHERRRKQAAGEREGLEVDYFDLILGKSRCRSYKRDRRHADDAQQRRAGYVVKNLQIKQPINSDCILLAFLQHPRPLLGRQVIEHPAYNLCVVFVHA